MNAIGKLITQGYWARLALARLLHRNGRAPHPLAEELAENGVIVLPGAFPPAEVDSLNRENRAHFDLARAEELVYSPDGKNLLEAADAPPEELRRFYFLHIKNYQLKFDAPRRLLPLLESVLSSYYRSRYYMRDVYCYRTQPVPRVQGSYAWHQDNYPPGSLKVMLYLTDVGPSSGPLTVALGSHKGFRPELGRTGDRHEDSWVRSRFAVRECLGPAGTVIVFNNNAIHRAADAAEGHRDVVNSTVFPCVLPGARPGGLDLTAEAGWLKRYSR